MILAIWSKDPYFVTVFGVQAAAMGVLAVIFYYMFRKLDDEDAPANNDTLHEFQVLLQSRPIPVAFQ
ncbi:hypothetical protein THASP1DRAFT_31980 [Thamnocephalis sphaerospora]|uniref:Uncharacterized protein n=1 Tax=Thamnocephalis sphaerospora TaxID=78915 RepID=A0A4P9XKB2_9FUNG|nr:hypothetical protein THASP1DRAFT_31980 [Thamnocephalis sphaerospora]|eukprot:RKP06205.1 hypothetical protein THASP1DRAFT_31980 [Thamnocephalis sphaerospora]